MRDKTIQFAKFCIVGVLNNLIYYITYFVLIKLDTYYILANIIGFTVSVFNSFYWNNKYVFGSDEKRVWWKTLMKTYISYAGTGILLSNVMLVLFVEIMRVPAIIAPLISLVVTIPVNYVVNKYWAYRSVGSELPERDQGNVRKE